MAYYGMFISAVHGQTKDPRKEKKIKRVNGILKFDNLRVEILFMDLLAGDP
jgi:hypothetical protein